MIFDSNWGLVTGAWCELEKNLSVWYVHVYFGSSPVLLALELYCKLQHKRIECVYGVFITFSFIASAQKNCSALLLWVSKLFCENVLAINQVALSRIIDIYSLQLVTFIS